jgi:predicted acyltransferase
VIFHYGIFEIAYFSFNSLFPLSFTVHPMQRYISLDALRGFAIAGMILSGSLPYNGLLPAWMYHAQVPPPTFTFTPSVPGITWVDLVFPFFLFALGVAIPLAYRHRPMPATLPDYARTLASVFQRGVLLAGFAIALQHCKPLIQSATPSAWHHGMAIIGFLLLFGTLCPIPSSYNVHARLRVAFRFFCACMLAGILMMLSYKGQSFSFERSDIIILVLANVSVSGTIIWLFTQKNHLLRLGILGFLLAFRLTQQDIGSWNHIAWYATPAPWLYKLYFHQYLCIVIPGTIIGDWIEQISSQQHDISSPPHTLSSFFSPRIAHHVIAWCSGILIIGNVVLLYARWLVPNLFFTLGILLFLHWYSRRYSRFAISAVHILHQKMLSFGGYWLLLGLAFEAFEGGIKKDRATLSYYFVTTGLACYALTLLSIICDIWQKSSWLRIIIESGQNPMLAYIAGSLLISPLLALTGGDTLLSLLNSHAWLGFIKGCMYTITVLLVTSIATRYGFYWKT